MQALIELLAGFIALLAAAALAQFGVDLNSAPPAPTAKSTASPTTAPTRRPRH